MFGDGLPMMAVSAFASAECTGAPTHLTVWISLGVGEGLVALITLDGHVGFAILAMRDQMCDDGLLPGDVKRETSNR